MPRGTPPTTNASRGKSAPATLGDSVLFKSILTALTFLFVIQMLVVSRFISNHKNRIGSISKHLDTFKINDNHKDLSQKRKTNGNTNHDKNDSNHSNVAHKQKKREANSNNNVVIHLDDDNDVAAPHLLPMLRPLPALAIIEEDEELKKNGVETLVQKTLDGTNPTMVGVTIILQRFMLAFHQATKEFAGIVEYKRQEKKRKRQAKNKNKEETINHQDGHYVTTTKGHFATYIDLVQEHLLPLDRAYRGKSIFPIRKDDSIFISIVSFRDQLLGATIYDVFQKAKNPEKVYLGIIVQNCFGIENTCKTGSQVVGKTKTGAEKKQIFDTTPDINGIEQFCHNETLPGSTTNYCNTGHIRALYVNETEAVGPAVARYFASKLWGGETYFMQIDSHLLFAQDWDARYIHELQISKSYPKSILSAYPPGFKQLFRLGNSSGTRLCACSFSEQEYDIIRISCGRNYPKEGYMDVPIKQVAFIAAGFFFVSSEWLIDVPFDPFIPWCFMGEEILLTMRSWTSGWNIYAPRINLIAHQYTPLSMGLPKFWETAGRTLGYNFHSHISSKVIQRIKLLVGYPGITNETINQKGNDEYEYDDITAENILKEFDHYGLGNVRSREEYLKHTKIDLEKKKCPRIAWCGDMTLE